MTSPTNAPILTIGLIALITGTATLAIGIDSDHTDAATWRAVTGVVTGWSFIAGGAIAWRRRPDNPFGPLMIVVGFLWFVRGWELANDPWIRAVGMLLDGVALAALIHALAIYPSGRFDSRLGQAATALAYITAVGIQSIQQLFNDPVGFGCTLCPENPIVRWPNRDVVDAIEVIQGPFLSTSIAILTVAALAYRWRRSTALQRRVLTPVLASFGLFATLFLAALILDVSPFDGAVTTALYIIAGLVMIAIPLVFLLGLLQRRLSRAAVAALVVDLSAGDPSPERLQRAIAEALGDTTLALRYRRPGEDSYVDGQGRPAPLPQDDPLRSWRTIEAGGQPIGALVFDVALLEEPYLIDGVAAATAFALENARLQAELRAQLSEVRASRARIVRAADTERRRLERNLHDGAQQRLLSLGIALRLLRTQIEDTQIEDAQLEDTQTKETPHAHQQPEALALLDEAEAEVRASIEELRELARGLHPTVLTDEGLEPALASLAQRAPLPVSLNVSLPDRLPATAEAAAYYVVSESVTNAAKHARASNVVVTLDEHAGQATLLVSDDGIGGADAAGSGLRGLADRVESIDGTFNVTSPPGGGTKIKAVIPCA